MAFFAENIATIVVGLLVLALVAFIIWRMRMKKKNNPGGCGCSSGGGCGGCTKCK